MKNNLFEKILNIGLEEDTNKFSMKRIKMINFIALILILSQPLFVPVASSNGLPPSLNLYFIALSVIMLWLQHKKMYMLSRWLFIIGSAVVYALINQALGKEGGTDFGIMALSLGCIFMFNSLKMRIFSIAVLVGIYISGFWIFDNYKDYYAEHNSDAAYYVFFAIIFLLQIIVVLFFVSDVDKYEIHMQSLLSELEESKHSLEVKNKELEKFAYIASHDLKTPVRTISSFINLAEKEAKPYNNERLNEFIQFAKDGSLQMNDLIQDVLEFSRLDHESVPKSEEVDLNLVLENIKESFRSYDNVKSIVKFDNFPKMKANKTHMYSVFNNIIENGLKYNDSAVREVNVQLKEKGNAFEININDNGIGIPEEMKPKVFEMFTRLHSRADYEGSGVGLAICKKIIESYQGSINIIDCEVKGTCFKLTFPKHLFILN